MARIALGLAAAPDLDYAGSGGASDRAAALVKSLIEPQAVNLVQ
ncbi:MAG TPA: hypothetical protein VLX09_07385 [Stellaceae bacterium]|nr:hypothetical protein [Stellaceae bacterium]